MNECSESMQDLLRLSVSQTNEPLLVREPRIYLQGDLDLFCGLYSIVNVVNKLRGPFPKRELKRLLIELAREYERRKRIYDALIVGIYGEDLERLIHTVAITQFDLVCEKPFHRNPNVRTDVVWRRMEQWVAEGGLVIFRTYKHWSVVKQVTDKSLYLLDSNRRKKYLRKSLIRKKDNPDRIMPQHLFFLKKKENV